MSIQGYRGGTVWPTNLPMLVLSRCGRCQGAGVAMCRGETRMVEVACPVCKGDGTVFVEVGGGE